MHILKLQIFVLLNWLIVNCFVVSPRTTISTHAKIFGNLKRNKREKGTKRIFSSRPSISLRWFDWKSTLGWKQGTLLSYRNESAKHDGVLCQYWKFPFRIYKPWVLLKKPSSPLTGSLGKYFRPIVTFKENILKPGKNMDSSLSYTRFRTTPTTRKRYIALSMTMNLWITIFFYFFRFCFDDYDRSFRLNSNDNSCASLTWNCFCMYSLVNFIVILIQSLHASRSVPSHMHTGRAWYTKIMSS